MIINCEIWTPCRVFGLLNWAFEVANEYDLGAHSTIYFRDFQNLCLFLIAIRWICFSWIYFWGNWEIYKWCHDNVMLILSIQEKRRLSAQGFTKFFEQKAKNEVFYVLHVTWATKNDHFPGSIDTASQDAYWRRRRSWPSLEGPKNGLGGSWSACEN